MNKNMKMGYFLTRPVNLEILAILVIAISFMVAHSHNPAQVPVLAVIHQQQVVAKNCTPQDRLLLVPYARWLSEIDATACPLDFFQAWVKYVGDVRTLSTIDHAEPGKAMASIGAAVVPKNSEASPGAIPKRPEQVEIARNMAAADWDNVKHVALRYGIKIAPVQYSESYVVGLLIV